jgi:hypothetical protein
LENKEPRAATVKVTSASAKTCHGKTWELRWVFLGHGLFMVNLVNLC